MKKIINTLKDFFNFKDWVSDLRAVPSLVVALLLTSTVLMNILANKSIIELPWALQDAGILVSWISFLVGDLLVKGFGSKTAIRVNLTCLSISLFISCILIIVSIIPGTWSPSYNYMDSNVIDAVNESINSVMGNVWYVILGSTFSSAVGLIINNLSQEFVLKKIELKHGDRYIGFLAASTASTIIGQFVDNMLFACLIGMNFFQWTWVQVVTCSMTGVVFEAVFELILTPVIYKISQNWKKNGIGNKIN